MADISMLSGVRVLVVGLGREGTALATYLARQKLMVVGTDLQPANQLGTIPASLQEMGISLRLGEHPLSLLDWADLVFVSPGIPLEIPFLQEARLRKIPLSTESRLFCHLCPAPILGITGSSGKTTTTTLVGKMIETDLVKNSLNSRKVWVGGNIGRPLIEVVDQISLNDTVVMELSSFQLEYFHAGLNQQVDIEAMPGNDPPALRGLVGGWSPSIGTILNITPNHLDRHPSMQHYVWAKQAILDYQGPEGVAVLSLDNSLTQAIGHELGSKVRWFSLQTEMPGGACLVDDQIVLLDQDGSHHPVINKQEIKLRGPHNISNILAACLMAREAGVSTETMQEVAATFSGVEHRLEWVRERNQVSYYNDSIATSPERLIAALHSFEEPIVLLAGGRDKHLPWEEAARLIVRQTSRVIVFGEAAGIIEEAIQQVKPEIGEPSLYRCANLEEAIHVAARLSQPGEVVLLSPGCASFDAFQNFAERGERFREIVLQL